MWVSSVMLSLAVLLDVIVVVVGQSVVKFPTSPRSSSSTRSSVHYAIEEEAPSGTPIGHGVGLDSGFVERLEAADDAAVIGNLRYRFLTQSPNYLELDERDGVLRTRGRLDREEICNVENDGVTQSNENSCQVRVDIAVQPMQYFQIFKVFITILDINDNDPSFPANVTRQIDIVESAPIGSRFPLPAAVDRDSPRFSIQRYAFNGVTSRPEMVFELRNDRNPDGTIDVRLVLVRSLDREIRPEYHFTLVAYDGGVPTPRSATCDIKVVVLDVNDNRPTFERNHYEASVVENAPIGTSVLRVHATDQDIGVNGVVRYQLASGSYGNLFSVNELTGDVTVVGALDYERATIHHILVSAIDGDGKGSPEVALSSDVTVQIRVVDVNDNAPMVTINTLTASGADVASVAEDAAVGTFVSHVIVSDPDSFSNGQTQCSVVNAGEGAPFSLEQMFDTEYQLVTTALLDREAVDRYSVTLLCQDTGVSPLSTTVQLEIDVTDVNDNCPTFRSTSPPSVDHDVTDRVTYVAELLENNFVGVFVSQLNASDLDSGRNGLINYILTDDPEDLQHVGRLYEMSGSDRSGQHDDVEETRWDIRDECSDKFTVDSMSGLVTAKTPLNFEQQTVYKCRILAVDGGTPPQTGEARLSVHVIDVNDERPRFSLDVYTFYVVENRPSGTLVGVVSATDADSPPFNQFTFSVMSAGSLSDAFQIDATSGKLMTTRLLDRERQDVYHLIVIAKDDQSPDVLSSTAAVTVYVTDVNDNAPMFLSSTSATIGAVTSPRNTSSGLTGEVFVVSSHTRLGSVVTRMSAVDADVGKNSQVSYSLQPSDGATSFRFDIDSHTGAVLLTDRLTAVDINATHQLTVIATDAGSPPLSTAIQITLKIVDGSLLSGAAAGNQLTSPLSRHDSSSHRIFIRYGLSGLIAVIILSVITVAVCILVLVVIVCVVRRRRYRHFVSKSSAQRDSQAAATSYSPPRGGSTTAAAAAGDKYNCRVEAMRAMSAVNHRDMGVSNSSKSLIRPLDTSPRLNGSGRVMLVSDGSCRNINKLDCDVTSDSVDIDHHFRTVDRRLTTFRQSPPLSHVSNNYWNNGYGLPVTSSLS